MSISLECKSCPVSDYCDSKGSSPSYTSKGKRVTCRVEYGIANGPVDPSILNSESKSKAEKNGYYLTLVEVPVVINESAHYKIHKVFSPPIKNQRGDYLYQIGITTPKSHK